MEICLILSLILISRSIKTNTKLRSGGESESSSTGVQSPHQADARPQSTWQTETNEI